MSMDLSRIAIQPRVRNTWEAIDLGFIMARRWYLTLFLSWAIPAFFTFILLSVLLYNDEILPMLITWWLKPLWDRGPLYIASRRLFGESVSLRDFFHAMPRLYKIDLLPWLLWRRFSLTRSFDMPITVLEQLKSSARKRRMNTLHLRTSNTAAWLTIVAYHMEAIAWMGMIAFVTMLIPDSADLNVFKILASDNYWVSVVSQGVYLLAAALAGPFYALGGFSLYINRRISLEAWDLEIRFRHLAQTRRQSSSGKVAAAILFVCLSASMLPDTGYAQRAEIGSAEQSRQLIDEILKGEEFHDMETVSGWRLKQQEPEQDAETPNWLVKLIRYLLELLFGDTSNNDISDSADIGIPQLLEALLWIALIGVIVYLLYRILQFYDILAPRQGRNKNERQHPPDIMFGLDVRRESIPEDVAGDTLSLWRQGQHREALGLLYRSTLSILIHRHAFQFSDGSTEQECADMVRHATSPELGDYFSRMTATWQALAYAHRLPQDEQVQVLCSQWLGVMNDEK